MQGTNFPWGLYAPGVTLIGIGILVLILPEFLVALVATLLFVAGIGALIWARKIHKGLSESNAEFKWKMFNDPR